MKREKGKKEKTREHRDQTTDNSERGGRKQNTIIPFQKAWRTAPRNGKGGKRRKGEVLLLFTTLMGKEKDGRERKNSPCIITIVTRGERKNCAIH